MANSRENILKKITSALQGAKVPIPFPEAASQKQSVFITQPQGVDIVEYFATEFASIGGKFLYASNETEMLQHLIQLADANDWKHVHCNEPFFSNYFTEQDIPFTRTGNSFEKMDAAITSCENAVARLGSLFISSASPSGRTLNVYCPIHLCIVYASQVVWDVQDATNAALEKYGTQLPSMLNLATGPSRTADIEKTLVVGVHGPKEVYVLFIDKVAPY